MSAPIPFSKPFTTGRELHYIAQAVTSGNIGADGPFTIKCGQLLERRFGIKKVLMTPSCTAALELAAMLCGLAPGDEVILPSFTFVSTANSFVRLGAKPIFVDIRPDTLNLDEEQIEPAITPRTKAIFPVHYAGVSSAMDRIMSIAHEYNLIVVEDAAQAVNSFHKGRALGTIGQLGAFSFHETKNYVCGEGGALCINDAQMIELAEIIREKGTNRNRFLRGEVDKYTWVDVGSSYLPNEIACAFLYAQLEAVDAILERRRAIYERYLHQLRPLETAGFLRLPSIPEECESNCHIFYVLLPNQGTRDELMTFLKRRDIQAVFHYIPLHSSPMGQRLGCASGSLPVTESVSTRLLRLPFYCDISEQDQTRIVEQITAFFQK
jgi:dTDP-4-amino-4,6-dideoxygalactose transaminase